MRFGLLEKAAALIALAAVSSVAAAQGATPPSEKRGFYVGAGGGATHVIYDASTFAPPAGTAWEITPNVAAAKGFLGWRLHKYFGVEGGYYYLGKVQNDYFNIGTGGGTATSKLDAWVVDAVGYIPLHPNFTAIGKVGATSNQIDTQVVGNTPANLASVSNKTTTYTWGIGAQLDFSEHWGIRAEYEYMGKFGNTNTGEIRAQLFSASALFKF